MRYYTVLSIFLSVNLWSTCHSFSTKCIKSIKFISRVEMMANHNNRINVDPFEPPRLNPDQSGLISWIEQSGGSFPLQIASDYRGWSLRSKNDIQENEIIAVIPKTICLSSSTKTSTQKMSPFLDSTQALMKSIDPKLWRVRLAIAVLSERVRPNSMFRPYIRNLPHEFRGLPMFYSSAEYEMISQDYALSLNTKERYKFLKEFIEQVLSPIPKNSPLNPFSGHAVDLNAFGWAFAAGSSRAIRSADVLGDEGPTLVPGIDFASHSFNPNCELLATDENYYLVTKKKVFAQEEITMNYGHFSNEELLTDYGFTVDNNPYDSIKIKCDAGLMNTARVVMGTGTLSNEEYTASSTRSLPVGMVPIGRNSLTYDELWLHSWQSRWLNILQLIGPKSTKAVSISGSNLSQIDGKLWAFLRILYSQKEDDILRHGYTPFTLQHPSSMLSQQTEELVISTLIGMISMLLHGYDNAIQKDIEAFIERDINVLPTGITYNSRDIIGESQKYVMSVMENISRNALNSNVISSPSFMSNIDLNTIDLDTLDYKGYNSNTNSDNNTENNFGNTDISTTIDNNISMNNNDQKVKLDEKYNWNIQEILKYRIRRKRIFIQLITNLIQHYQKIAPNGQLLPSENQKGRQEKIKNFMNDIINRESNMEDYTSAASKLSSLWSNRSNVGL